MKYPVLLAKPIHRENGISWEVWCPYCDRFHYHGATEGHRVAHCAPETPFSDLGYIIKKDRRFVKKGEQ